MSETSNIAPGSNTGSSPYANINCGQLAQEIKRWGQELGFQKIGISDIQLDEAETHLLNWLNQGFHGEMDYMARHGQKRSRPAQLEPGTLRIISGRMDYLPQAHDTMQTNLDDPARAFISRYALGRDYHKLLRKRLQQLAHKIESVVGKFGYRVFTDSAPVLEKAIAEKAGLGWIGKHSNVIDEHTGSWFFLGEIFIDLPLPIDTAATNHCGTCHACLDACPTDAIVAPYQVDARRCISYLTIELKGSIPLELRPLMGNRIYGCDDCQLVCPWNKFACITDENDFHTRHGLDSATLIELFRWSEAQFLNNTEGSAIRRIGYERWLRNIAVALGNAPTTPAVICALEEQTRHTSNLVQEHVSWALQRHGHV